MATKKNTEIKGNEYYRITRTIDGKKKQFYGTSKGNAEKKYRQYLEELAKRKERYGGGGILRDLADEYIDNTFLVSSKYANSTKEKYYGAYKCYIRDSKLAQKRIDDIRPADLQKFYNDLDVSKNVIEHIQKFLKGFYKWLELNEYGRNIITAVDLPDKPANKKSEDIITWSDEEVETIISASLECSDSFRAFFIPLVLIYTGMRIGELLSLRYSDFHDGIIDIKRQYTHGEVKAPKYNSKRQIPIHPDLQEAFELHKAWHEEEMKRNGYKTEYVFTTDSGRLYDPGNIRTALKRFYKRIGVENKGTHTYRRTFCTRLCTNGVPIQVASNLMGHKNISVTAKFYTGIDQTTKEYAIQSLNW